MRKESIVAVILFIFLLTVVIILAFVWMRDEDNEANKESSLEKLCEGTFKGIKDEDYTESSQEEFIFIGKIDGFTDLHAVSIVIEKKTEEVNTGSTLCIAVKKQNDL